MTDKAGELIAEIASIDSRIESIDADNGHRAEIVHQQQREIERNVDTQNGLRNRRRKLFADLRSELGVWPERKPPPVETYEDPDEDPFMGKPAIDTYADLHGYHVENPPDADTATQADFDRRVRLRAPATAHDLYMRGGDPHVDPI